MREGSGGGKEHSQDTGNGGLRRRNRAGDYAGRAAGAAEGAEPLKKSTTSAQLTPVGVDVFVHWKHENAEELAAPIQKAQSADLPLTMITNRGVKVGPHGHAETFCTDHWRCQFHAEDDYEVSPRTVLELPSRMDANGVGFNKTEKLYLFEGKPGYSLGQGQ